MDQVGFREFTEELRRTLAADARVVGLVALGSTAMADYEPDEWSDHDVFVVVHPGHEEAFRTDLSWLPRSGSIAMALRETEHGLKVLYDDAHLVELAVFTPDQLRVAKAGRSRLLHGGDDLRQMIEGISGEIRPRSGGVDVRFELGMFVTNLYVGAGRHRRGERLSGHQFVFGHALGHLLRALTTLPSPTAGLLDGLDVRRRFERSYPDVGAELDALLEAPFEAAVVGLLGIARRQLGSAVPADVGRAMAAVERRLIANR